ncbi:MAG: thiamine phosphate synthase [Micavibrio aeruginosavorus]|uniref:Thiamine phosphate synthase n=1 Tax=Micavibrio aeruginosavorus TaxID=349221 RepID=A0A7T5R1Q8_9BACT|nr:MAG: thiamine phosphate synthase [Micavibrio aeruginosavorus]
MAKETKKGAPACGLYLRVADDLPFETAMAQIREAAFVINRSAYEKNMNVLEIGGSLDDEEGLLRMQALVELARQLGVVAIVRNHAGLAFAAEADGVILEKIEDVEAARAVMGSDAIIGVRCGLSRLTAEKALDVRVDYISFAAGGRGDVLPPESLVGWWSVKSDTPCLIEGSLTNDDCGRYVRAGATFLEASDYVWNHPKGIKQGTIDMLYAIELAMESQSVQ